MANEKLAILKMLESGKITAAEAARLLESVGGGTKPADAPAPAPPGPPPMSVSPGIPPSGAGAGPVPPGVGNGPAPSGSGGPGGYGAPYGGSAHAASGRNINDIAGELSRKFEAFARDMEPKLQKWTEAVAEKLVSGADHISRSMGGQTEPAGATPGQAPRPSAPMSVRSAGGAMGTAHEKNFEMTVAEGYNELSLAGLNGNVRIKGYNGDKITARVAFKARRPGAAPELMKLGGKYFLKYEEDEFEHVTIDAYVPERLFKVVNLSGINGNLDVSSLAAQEVRLANANGQTGLTGCAAEQIKIDCSNGKLTLANIAADALLAENFNGAVDMTETDVAKLSLTNFNGPVALLVSQFARYADYLWSVEASNARMSLNLPTLPDLGYHIKAHTTLGDIRIGLTGLQFLINDPSLVEAQSTQLDRAAKKVRLILETSNAGLTVN